jgi:hypothetical protein
MEKQMRYPVFPLLGIVLLMPTLGCASDRTQHPAGQCLTTWEPINKAPATTPPTGEGPELGAPANSSLARITSQAHPADHAANPAEQEPTMTEQLSAEQRAARSSGGQSPYASGQVKVSVWSLGKSPVAKPAAGEPEHPAPASPALPALPAAPVPPGSPEKTVLAVSGPTTGTPSRCQDRPLASSLPAAVVPGKAVDGPGLLPAPVVQPAIQPIGWKDPVPPPPLPRGMTTETALPQFTPPPRMTAAGHPGDSAPPSRASFAHASDYSWVSGELDYVYSKKAWRVRYATLDEEDRYGGSVLLASEDESLLQRFKPGQMVRVEGHLVKPDAREGSPLYRIDSISSVP